MSCGHLLEESLHMLSYILESSPSTANKIWASIQDLGIYQIKRLFIIWQVCLSSTLHLVKAKK